MHIIRFFNLKSQLSHKKQPTAAHCGRFSRLASLAASGFVTLRRDKRSPCKSTLSRRSLGEDGSPRFSLAKPDLASHCIRRQETGSFERNCFGQKNLSKSLAQIKICAISSSIHPGQ